MRFRKILFLLACVTSITGCWRWHHHDGDRHDGYAQRDDHRR
jgi:hypothetical protein